VSETLTTNEVVVEAVDGSAPEVSEKFSPKAGGTFLAINIASCGVEGSYEATRTAECECQGRVRIDPVAPVEI
jgi:hypothetical protein